MKQMKISAAKEDNQYSKKVYKYFAYFSIVAVIIIMAIIIYKQGYKSGIRYAKDKINKQIIINGGNKINNKTNIKPDVKPGDKNLTLSGTEPKVAICCIAKEENKYIAEYVKYYKELGVDKIFIYDDNVPGGEKVIDVLNTEVQNGYVEINNTYQIYKKLNENFQGFSYTDCYKRHESEYDWLFFIDIDEFIEIKNNKTLKQFLSDSLYTNCERIVLNWLCYGDSDLLHYEDKPVIERFKYPIELSNHNNKFVKSLYRGKINKKVGQIGAHYPSPNPFSTCDDEGKGADGNSDSIFTNKYTNALIRHYCTKSAEEYVQKLIKFREDMKINSTEFKNYAKEKVINVFFVYNKITKEKIEIFEKELGISLAEYKK